MASRRFSRAASTAASPVSTRSQTARASASASVGPRTNQSASGTPASPASGNQAPVAAPSAPLTQTPPPTSSVQPSPATTSGIQGTQLPAASAPAAPATSPSGPAVSSSSVAPTPTRARRTGPPSLVHSASSQAMNDVDEFLRRAAAASRGSDSESPDDAHLDPSVASSGSESNQDEHVVKVGAKLDSKNLRVDKFTGSIPRGQFDTGAQEWWDDFQEGVESAQMMAGQLWSDREKKLLLSSYLDDLAKR